MQPQQIVVRRTELPGILRLSLPTIDRLRAQGDFPVARRLSRQSICFLRSDIEAWLASRPVVNE